MARYQLIIHDLRSILTGLIPSRTFALPFSTFTRIICVELISAASGGTRLFCHRPGHTEFVINSIAQSFSAASVTRDATPWRTAER